MEFPEPSIALLLLGSCGPGKRGDDEMSLSGININKKQMNLRGGGGGRGAVINQPRHKATYGKHSPGWLGRDFLMATSCSDLPAPPPLPGSGLSPSSFGANPGLEGGAVLGAGDSASFAAPFVNFCASSYQRIRVAQHPPLPRVHGAAPGGGYVS